MRKISTIAGIAAVALAADPRAFANPAGNTAKRVEPVLTGIAAIPLPERASKRGSISLYPFDTLANVGEAFGVTNKTAAQLSSIVSNANRKAMVPETDAAGNAVYNTKELVGADGSKTTVPDSNNPKMKAGKHFFAFDVTPEYRDANKASFAKGATFEGATVLVFRDK